MTRHLRLIPVLPSLLVTSAAVAPESARSQENQSSFTPTETALYWGNPGRTGEAPSPGPEAEPKLLWRFATEAPVTASLAVVGGVVFAGGWDHHLYVLDAATGN